MKASEIRDKFLQFFEAKGHTVVPSSSLVPSNDPTLLFTNSGMVPFKDVFTGQEKRPYSRAASSQRSVRAGGKHNDLENVGYTARHHTFFEMLGNFSFGDYFKRDAIAFAWEMLTQVYQLPAEKLYVTVYQEDDEAYSIWQDEVGVPAERIIRIGDNKGARYASDNFWQMAETGPCGPSSEIFYDHGPGIWGGLPGTPEEDGDRYIEIWNLVFMQFDRSADGTLNPLPRPCVDTGMGLERIAAVLQGVHSNYEIDLFQHLIQAAAREVTQQGGVVDLAHNSLKVIGDHIRACAFLVVDGVIPGNEGRGYVLRRIVRRAIRHGYKLGCRQPFLNQLVPDLVQEMGQAYPELTKAAEQVQAILKVEEERFFETIENGMTILESALEPLTKGDQLDGAVAFKLHDTYGFPLDLTADVCRERDICVDEAAFTQAMAHQKEQARAAGKFKAGQVLHYDGVQTQFEGYDHLALDQATVTALVVEGTSVQSIEAGQHAVVVLNQTPFYAESGGQVGDQGELITGSGRFEVHDTQKIQPKVFGHQGVLVEGGLQVGDSVAPAVNQALRDHTVRNHSATHLMHKALREVLGDHVAQKGSLVDAQKTRFDFSHHSALTAEQIAEVELRVNQEILANQPTQARTMSLDTAKEAGAMMLFGEKYGETVRVLNIGSSCELCGGTHVARTGDIGLFKITSEAGVAAGIRRVEATTGLGALEVARNAQYQLDSIASLLRAPAAQVSEKISALLEQVRAQDKTLARLQSQLASSQGSNLAGQAVDVSGVQVLATLIDGAGVPQLREAADQLRNKLGRCALVLAAVSEGKVSLIAAVSKELTSQLKAGELVNFVAQQVGGKGGGRPDMAQAGGTQPKNLNGALASVGQWVQDRLAIN